MTRTATSKRKRAARRRCETGKVPYRDEIDAKLAMATIVRRDKLASDYKPTRAYRCNLCPSWHITHKPLLTRSDYAKVR